jgi:hypothetical protein
MSKKFETIDHFCKLPTSNQHLRQKAGRYTLKSNSILEIQPEPRFVFKYS